MIDRRFPGIFHLSTVWTDWDESAQETILSRTIPFMIRWMQSRSCFPKRHVASIATKFWSGGLPRRVCHRTMTGTTQSSLFRTWQNLSFCQAQNIPFYGYMHLLKYTSGFPLGETKIDMGVTSAAAASDALYSHTAWQVSCATGLRNFSKSIHRDRWIDVSSEHRPSIQRSRPDRTGRAALCTEIVRNISIYHQPVESAC